VYLGFGREQTLLFVLYYTELCIAYHIELYKLQTPEIEHLWRKLMQKPNPNLGEDIKNVLGLLWTGSSNLQFYIS
jgi:hypothetical protein